MTVFLRANAIRIFDSPQFAAGLRDAVRENAAKVANAASVIIATWSRAGRHCRRGSPHRICHHSCACMSDSLRKVT